MPTYILTYEGLNKNLALVRKGNNVKVQADSQAEAIAMLEKQIKARFPKIVYFFCYSCISESAHAIYLRGYQRLETLNKNRNANESH